jgi:hypothetical protein
MPLLRMILSENRIPPRIKSGAGFFGIMRGGRNLGAACDFGKLPFSAKQSPDGYPPGLYENRGKCTPRGK